MSVLKHRAGEGLDHINYGIMHPCPCYRIPVCVFTLLIPTIANYSPPCVLLCGLLPIKTVLGNESKVK